MAPPRKKGASTPASSWRSPTALYSMVKSFLLTTGDASALLKTSVLLLVLEVVLNYAVIQRVAYTEIDWVAYMQEVAPVIHNSTFDYSQLRGDTGPLVYPAGFVWIFSAFYWLTDQGGDLRLAQYLYAALYLLTLSLVFRLMTRTRKVPPLALILMSVASRRIHSIFVLRLFNDPVAMLLAYAAINFFLDGHWTVGSVFFSLAVSVKMNVLLFAPALFLAYLATQGLIGTVKQLAVCAGIQLVVAAPFLATNPLAYLAGSFDFGRVFLYEWTVNWRFLSEQVFVSRPFHILLLFLHGFVLLLCAPKWWKMLKSYAILMKHKDQVPTDTAAQLFIWPLFMCNFVGVAFARSLHYQFYVWYFHQLHYLLWCTKLPVVAKVLLLGVVELCWNVFPSTVWSSAFLHMCHLVLMVSLLANMYGIAALVDRVLLTIRRKRE